MKSGSFAALRFLALLGVAACLMTACSRDAKKARYLANAEAQFQSGDYARAELEYLNLLRLDPTNGVAIRNLGLMAFEQGRTVRAYALLAEAARVTPDDPVVGLKFAMVQFMGGQPREARTNLLRLLSRAPTNDEALIFLVESSRSTNDLQETRQLLDRLKPAVGSRPGYHLALGSLALRDRDTNAAAAAFRQALSLDAKSSAAHAGLGSIYALESDTNNASTEFKTASELAPPRSSLRLRYADYQIALGDLAAGRTALEQIIKQTPDYLPALMRLAQLSLSERRLAECEGTLKSILSQEATHLEAILLMARLKLLQNQPANAVLELERGLKIYPAHPQLHYQMALSRLLQNNLSEAVISLNSALKSSPDYPEAVLLLAELDLRRGDSAKAIASLNQFLKKRPSSAQAQSMLANAYRATGKLDSALAIYQNFSRSFPTNPQPQFSIGLVQLQQGNQVAARRSFESALQLAPDFMPATEQLVRLDLNAHDFVAALNRAQNEVTRAPTNDSAYVLLAKVQLAQTNLAAAESTLKQALGSSPDSPSAASLLAKVYAFSKKQEAALKQLRELVARNANDIASWMMIAELHSAVSNYSAARDAYQTVLNVNPNYARALNNLAWLYCEQLLDPRSAYEPASKAHDLNPRDAATSDTFGWVLYRLGDFPRALGLIQESAQVLSEQPEVLFHLGMTHYVMGEEAAARVALQSALQLSDEQASWRSQAQEALRILAIDPLHLQGDELKFLQSRASNSTSDPIVFSRLGAMAEQQGQTKQAVEVYEKALQVNSNLVPVIVSLARLYSTNPKNPDRAFALARRARVLEPGDPTIAHTLGRLAYDAAQTPKDYEWALGLLQESARALADDAGAQFDLANATFALGDLSNARSLMQKVLTLNPKADLKEAANLFLEMDRLAREPTNPSGAAQVQAVLQRRLEHVPALLAQAALQVSQKDFSAAATTYEQVLTLLPAFYPADKALAMLYASHLNDPQKAYIHASKARDADSRDSQLNRLLGDLEYARGEYSRAAQLLKDCLPAYPNDAELLYTLGLAQYRLKQSRESKETLTKALSMLPNSPSAAEAKRVLSELK